MLTSLLAHVQTREPNTNCLDYMLPRLIRNFQADFRIFADCGGGVGHTSAKYAIELKSNLDASFAEGAAITTFEPLPENYEELSRRAAAHPNISPLQKAVSDYIGEAEFVIPRRMSGNSSHWGAGTSAVGYLGKGAAGATSETIKVGVTRLDTVRPSGFDFIKLDLQGGERSALKGAGETLKSTKVVYAEHQMLAARDSQPLDFLTDNGFICYFDRIQFGLRDSDELPLALLEDGGIRISRVKMPDGRGLPMIIWGELTFGKQTRLDPSGEFEVDYAAKLKKAGVYYLQTDVVAINAEHYSDIIKML